jgi:hypothetical protein
MCTIHRVLAKKILWALCGVLPKINNNNKKVEMSSRETKQTGENKPGVSDVEFCRCKLHSKRSLQTLGHVRALLFEQGTRRPRAEVD